MIERSGPAGIGITKEEVEDKAVAFDLEFAGRQVT